MHGWRRFTRAAFLHVVPLARREHQVTFHVSKGVSVLRLSSVTARQEHVASIGESRWRSTAPAGAASGSGAVIRPWWQAVWGV